MQSHVTVHKTRQRQKRQTKTIKMERHTTKGLVLKQKALKSISWRDLDSQNISATNLILKMILEEHKWSHGKRKSMHWMIKYDPTIIKSMSPWGGERREHGLHRLC